MSVYIHETATVSDMAQIGAGTSIWNHAQVREQSVIGERCIISKGAYIDTGVVIGSDVKVQNYVSIYHGVVIEDGVMVGPHVCFTNDRLPRAIRPDGARKGADDWQVSETRIAYGAGLGANSTIVCGVVVGRWALVGAGSVVTRDVPPYGLVFGNPARLRGFVSPAGVRAQLQHVGDEQVVFVCPESQEPFTIPRTDYALLEQDTR